MPSLESGYPFAVNTDRNEFNPWPYARGRRLLFLRAERGWSPAIPVETPLDTALCLEHFPRGDTNADSALDIADAIFILSYLFADGQVPPCLDAADANDDGTVDIADGIYVLQNLFASGPAIPPPYPECGIDPTEDADGVDLGCESYEPCE